MRKLLNLFLIVGLFSLMLTSCNKNEVSVPDFDYKQDGPAVEALEIKNDKGANMNPKVEISIKDYGIIRLELDKSQAPITVDNFVKLVNEKFYDGLTFHRIIEGFMMQGGDPLGNGRGGSKDNIKGEFASNGVNNTISHKRGVISMARSQFPDSASSQFFIMHQDGEFLDGQYAAFGHVTSGIEVVDKVCESAIVEDNNGTVAPENQPKIEYIKIIE